MTFKINGATMPYPSELAVGYQDIDGETYRNAKGEMIRDRIAVKRKLTLKWRYLNNSEVSKLLKAVDASFFTVTYFDPHDGKDVTKTMYVGDRTAPAYRQDAAGKFGWKDTAFNLIEK